MGYCKQAGEGSRKWISFVEIGKVSAGYDKLGIYSFRLKKGNTLYKNFACAYGTLWLITFSLALITQSHIDTGAFGLIGFPIIAIIYSFKKPEEINQMDHEALIKHLKNKVYRLEKQIYEQETKEQP